MTRVAALFQVKSRCFFFSTPWTYKETFKKQNMNFNISRFRRIIIRHPPSDSQDLATWRRPIRRRVRAGARGRRSRAGRRWGRTRAAGRRSAAAGRKRPAPRRETGWRATCRRPENARTGSPSNLNNRTGQGGRHYCHMTLAKRVHCWIKHWQLLSTWWQQRAKQEVDSNLSLWQKTGLSHRKRSWESPVRGRAASEPRPEPDYPTGTGVRSLHRWNEYEPNQSLTFRKRFTRTPRQDLRPSACCTKAEI